MGNSSYSTYNRSIRSESFGYASKSRDEIFTQSKEGKSHEQMNPKGIVYRECRDSEAHPNSTPIQLYLDVTGSMGHIPHEMIKEGLEEPIYKLKEMPVVKQLISIVPLEKLEKLCKVIDKEEIKKLEKTRQDIVINMKSSADMDKIKKLNIQIEKLQNPKIDLATIQLKVAELYEIEHPTETKK